MQTFKVDGMTCAHCERAVSVAIQAVDPGARVDVDRAAGLVRTDSGASPARLLQAIGVEGYAASPVAAIV